MVKKDINNNGFTLIELLVVISIIGILSSLAVVSLNDARLKARDAKRKADMTQTRLALYLYYDDNNNYPICGIWDEGETDYGASPISGSNCYNTALADALTSSSKPYMSDAPADPLNPGNTTGENGTYIYRYVSTSSGDQFAIVFETEDPNDSSPLLIRGW